jgi:hypothetical protein
MNTDVESRLRHFAQEAALRRRAPAASPGAVAAVKQFQRKRLARANADLLQSDRYRLAARFFLDELYGVKDFTSRDDELARMIPSMSRLLPAAALGVLADAIELDAISEQLDEEIAALLDGAAASAAGPASSAGLPGNLSPAGPAGPAGSAGTAASAGPAALTQERYLELYRAVGRRDLRLRQIALVEDVGRQLDKLVHKPFLYRILKAMEGPARLAGLAQMQSFLVDGFLAFRSMGASEEFVQTVVTRERAVMEAAFAGAAAPQAGGADGSAGSAGAGPIGSK